jgi:hypothetical protein
MNELKEKVKKKKKTKQDHELSMEDIFRHLTS